MILLITAVSCKTASKTTSTDDGRISIDFIQVNDVYEIAPLSEGKEGGLARVASIKKKYLSANPNTFLIMAGDFLSPSVYNSLKNQGKAIRGKQMIEAMNAAGFDLAIFGNHEFDIKESELQERINESAFQWIASNTYHKKKDMVTPFVKTIGSVNSSFPVSIIKTVSDADGTIARIGFIGLTLPFNRAGYVSYSDVITSARILYDRLKDSTDAVVAITHQSIEDDEKLAREIPGLALIMGGHEHDQQFKKIGHIYITKAMANAKSAFVINLSINKNRKSIKIKAHPEKLDETVLLDSTTNTVVQRWVTIAEKSYASLGFDAKKIVLSKGEPLDGRETEIRSKSTNLTRLIVQGIADTAKNADVVIMNAGSIRVDDMMQMPVTQYDIIRSLPFGGSIREAEMMGSLLLQILDQGLKNKGIGGYLHYNDEVSFDSNSNSWKLKNTNIDSLKTYRVALPDFLLTGGESNLGFLKPGNSSIVKIFPDPASDIRLAIIKYLEKK